MFAALIQRQRNFFNSGKTLPLDFRIGQLKRLKDSIDRNENLILEALHKDLRKSEIEAYNSEVLVVTTEIDYVLKRIGKWTRPRKVRTPWMHLPAKSLVYPEPAGVVLILAPWNYPFQLTFAPLIGAIAAGNCAVLKPSEYAPHMSAAMAEIIRNNFEQDCVTAAEGGVEVSKALLQERFDHIFFTGSTNVGKMVMRAASQHLTPVTLELGGRGTSSGGVCINDTVSHIVGSDLPFGGVGESGFGNYHGRASFDSFTHYKSVLRRSFSFDSKMKYPPYQVELKKIKRILKFLLR